VRNFNKVSLAGHSPGRYELPFDTKSIPASSRVRCRVSFDLEPLTAEMGRFLESKALNEHS
jgi:hypothetical protein